MSSSCYMATLSGLLNLPGFRSLIVVFQKVHNPQYRCGCFLAWNQLSLWPTGGTIWPGDTTETFPAWVPTQKVAGFYVTARVTGQSNHLRLLTSVIGYICHPRRHATAVLSSRREAQDVIICHILLGKCPGMLQDPRSCSLNSLLLRQALMPKGLISWAAYALP